MAKKRVSKKRAPATKAAVRRGPASKKAPAKKDLAKRRSPPKKPNRTALGQFGAGNTAAKGNRGGSPKSNRVKDAKAAFFSGHLDNAEAILKDVLIVRSASERARDGIDISEQLAAAKMVVEYSFGKPTQPIEINKGYMAEIDDACARATAHFLAQAASGSKA